VEAHLFEFAGDLYDQRLRLEFLQRLRGEQRFASAAELIAQIRQDAQEAQAILARRAG
jgi:riboflavin kinase/FMN adenylyltransferase